MQTDFFFFFFFFSGLRRASPWNQRSRSFRKEIMHTPMCTLSHADSSVSLMAWEGWGSGWCENASHTAALWQRSLEPAVVSIRPPPVLWTPLQPAFNSHRTHQRLDVVDSFSISTEIMQTVHRLKKKKTLYPALPNLRSNFSFFRKCNGPFLCCLEWWDSL